MAESVNEAFGLGRVVIPASDGLLKDLGHDVRALGERAFGVVVEARPKKSLVDFPELKTRLWIAHTDMADIEEGAREDRAGFRPLLPDFAQDASTAPLVWWLWYLCQELPVTHVLNLESGPLREVWDAGERLEDFYRGDADVSVAYVGIGVSELVLRDWHRIESTLSDRLLFARFLPAGMHKLEIALYLKR